MQRLYITLVCVLLWFGITTPLLMYSTAWQLLLVKHADQPAPEDLPPPVKTDLALSLEVAGPVVTIMLAGEVPPEAGERLELVLSTPAGPLRYSLFGSAFTLDPLYAKKPLDAEKGLKRWQHSVTYNRAGAVPYSVSFRDHILSGTLTLTAESPLNPLNLLVLGKQYRATSPIKAAFLVQATDAYGNISDAPIDITVQYPDVQATDTYGNISGAPIDIPAKHIEEYITIPQYLVAWGRFSPGDVVGTVRLSATSDQSYGEAAEIDVVPGVLQKGELDILNSALTTDARNLWKVHAHHLRDNMNHPLLDGSAIHLMAHHGGRNYRLTQSTTLGQAHFVLPSSDMGDVIMMWLQGSVYQTPNESRKWRLIEPFIAELKADILGKRKAQGGDGQVLHIGPVTDKMHALVDDGYSVIATFTNADDVEVYKVVLPLVNGEVMWPLSPPAEQATKVQLAFAGLEVSLNIAHNQAEIRISP